MKPPQVEAVLGTDEEHTMGSPGEENYKAKTVPEESCWVALR